LQHTGFVFISINLMKNQWFSGDIGIVANEEINIKHVHFHCSISILLCHAVFSILIFLLGLTIGIDYLPARTQLESCGAMSIPLEPLVRMPNASAAV
jgi:hypothetical protein